MLDRLRQSQGAHEVAEVGSQNVKLKPDLVVAEFPARQTRPSDGILAFHDTMFGCAPLVVKGHHAFGGLGQVGDDCPTSASVGQKSISLKDGAETAVGDIRRKTRKQHSAEEKIRIVLSGLRGEDSIGRVRTPEQ